MKPTPPSDPAHAAAKTLFFEFDGSRFYMSRNDMEQTYARYEIPRAEEAEWLEELAAEYLTRLSSPGNWRSVNFFRHHGDGRYLRQVIDQEPKGKLWERTAYLELALDYVNNCGSGETRETRRGMKEAIANNARKLLASCRSDHSRQRVNTLIAKIEGRRA